MTPALPQVRVPEQPLAGQRDGSSVGPGGNPAIFYSRLAEGFGGKLPGNRNTNISIQCYNYELEQSSVFIRC